MKNISLGLGTAAVALLALSGFADPVRLTNKSGLSDNYALYGESQYAADQVAISNAWATAYTDGRVPHAGADYLLAGDSGYSSGCRSCLGDSSHRAFLGDSLQLGRVGAGRFDLHQRMEDRTGSSVSTAFTNLILANGSFYHDAAGAPYYKMTGNVTVTSPATAPFSFYAKNTLYLWRLASDVSGASGTGLKFYATNTQSKPVVYLLSGDNSLYAGSYFVTAENTYLCFTGNGAIGSNTAADAITLTNGGGVGAAEGVVTFSSGAGVTVEATGGALYAAAGSIVNFSLPVTGSGPVRVCGGGCFVLDGDYQAGTITVAADTAFIIGDNADLHDAQVVYEGGGALSLPFDGSTNTVDFSEHNGAKILFNHNGSSVLAGCTELTGIPATWPLAIEIGLLPTRPAADERFPILRIPTSLKTVTEDDFFVSNTEPFDHKLSVETADGMQTVYLRFPNILQAVDVNNYISTWKDGTTEINVYAKKTAGGTTWSDFLEQYADYAWDWKLRSTCRFNSSYHNYPYIGVPLSCLGTGTRTASTDNRLDFCIKSGPLSFSDLRFYGNMFIYGNNTNPEISGKLSILSAEETPSEIMPPNESGTKMTVSAAIHGNGFASLVPMYGYNYNTKCWYITYGRELAFTGDNAHFLGTFDARSAYTVTEADIATNFFYWSVSNGNGFGGNNATFTADAVRLRGGTVLKIANDVTMPYPNRGFTVSEWPTIEVATGKTFRITSKVTINGRLTKTGAGRLILADVAAAEGAELVVSAGEVVFGCAVPEALTVTPAGAVTRMAVLPASGTATYPSDLPAGAKLLFGDGATGCFEMNAEAKPDFWPIGILVMRPTDVTVGASYPILKIPTSVRTVTLNDFYSAAIVPQYETYTITTDGNGVQTLSVSFPEVLTAVRMQNGDPLTVWKRDDGVRFTNEESNVYAYRVNETACSDQLRVMKLSRPFAGQSLSIGRSDFKALSFNLRDGGFNLAGTRFYGGADLVSCTGSSLQTIDGDITVAGTEAVPTRFVSEDNASSYNRSYTYKGRLRGEGFLQCHASGLKQPVINLTGDNSAFVGTLDVGIAQSLRSNPMFDPTDGVRTNYLSMTVSSAQALGGALPAFAAQATRLGWSTALRVTGDVTLPANRGFYVYDSPLVDVSDGKTFAATARTTVNGTLEKSGTGTLALGDVVAEDATADEEKRLITVTEGALVITGGVENVKIAFSDSLTLSLSRREAGDAPVVVNTVDDAPFGSSGAINLAWNAGEEPTAERRKVTLPLMKVKTSAATGILSRLVYPETVSLHRFSTEDQGDGTTLITLSARVLRGSAILFR